MNLLFLEAADWGRAKKLLSLFAEEIFAYKIIV